MQLHLQQTPEHQTFDHHPATYCVVRDALTGRREAMFQVVQLGEGVRQYRTMDRRSMPPDFTFDEAIRLAMADETKRRATRPLRLPKPQDTRPRPQRANRWYAPVSPSTPIRRFFGPKSVVRSARKQATV
jgi:hypothetical protein